MPKNRAVKIARVKASLSRGGFGEGREGVKEDSLRLSFSLSDRRVAFSFFFLPPLSFFRRGSPGSTHARARSHFHRVALPFRTRRTSRKRRARTRGRTRNDVTLRHTNGRRGGRTNRQIGWVGKKIITKREREREKETPTTSVRRLGQPYATSARMTSFSRRREKEDRAI